jgi:hypothetical protein
VRGVLRILLELVERCQPHDRAVLQPAAVVALLLWFPHGFCRPDPPRPADKPWPFVEPPNRFALRDSKGKYLKADVLPTVEETSPWVVTGRSVRKLAKATQNMTRERHGEYDEVVRPRRDGSAPQGTATALVARPEPPSSEPAYDVSLAAARALNAAMTADVTAALAEATRAGRASRILVVETPEATPPDWTPPIDADEVVLVSAPLPRDCGSGVVMLLAQKVA